jgi:ATP-binding cassette subfamily F protein uup
MALLALRDVRVAFGGPPILDGAACSLDRGERVALVGRNGAGKSTLMQVLDGTLKPDAGEVIRRGGVTVARLEQDLPTGTDGTIFDVAAAGLGEAGRLLARYHAASHRIAADASDAAMAEFDRLSRAVEAADAWQLQTRVETVLSHLQLDPDAPFAAQSGGRKRQTLLARALVREPDVLLLDEPTNHLDIAAIEWLEEFILGRGLTLLFITHDRAFLRRIATRILELDRGRLSDWGGDYDLHLERKAASLDAEAKGWAEFDKKLAREEVWIRTGIQARRTRNEGRVRALEQLRRDRAARRDRVGTAKLQLQEGERSGRVVADVKGLTFAHGERVIVRDFTATVVRGDRIGLIGPNGVGKTTLLRLLLGELQPDAGTVTLGTNLEIAYFDQLRDQLDPDATVYQSIADGADWVELDQGRQHVNGYLQDFLFGPERARTPVRALSGGERNRLLLARLFTRRFNVLVMDEPTNDLDIETLDLLEQRLADFGGTLLLVSHDRAFLDAVVTSSFVFEGNGRVTEYVGGYSDWIRQRGPAVQPRESAERRSGDAKSGRAESLKGATTAAASSSVGTATAKKRKLTYKEQLELQGLPDRIESLEQETTRLQTLLGDPSVTRDPAALTAHAAQLADAERRLSEAMARWELLEELARSG